MESANKHYKPSEILGKGFLFSIVLFLAIGFLRRWLSPPIAAALVTFCLGLIIYWIPPRPKMTFGRWLVKVVQWTVLLLLLGLVYSFVSKLIV